jgi:murein DD-endopeptidase MepM/ murein hydrolase activator NlpD
VTAAGCADSARFDSNPFASSRNAAAPAPAPEVTGSIRSSRPAGHVETQPLPAPTKPASGVANGAGGLGAYRPVVEQTDRTGSVRVASTPAAPPAPVQQRGHWTWDGGSPVVVGRGETLEAIARKYGVPASAILETNGLRNAAGIHAGQRLVIPRYVVGEARAPAERHEAPRVASRPAEPPRQHPQVAAAPAPRPAQSGDIHVVQPGETLIGIARRHELSLSELARANRIQPYTKLAIGDRLVLPAHARAAQRAPERVAERAPAPRHEARLQARSEPRRPQPQRAPEIEKVSSVPVENARVATPEPAAASEDAVKRAEPVTHALSFRWPVTGHVIEAFGSRPNGTTNDGINLAVPEGTPIKAAEDGIVAYAGNELKGYGNLVLIRHADNYVSAYANASEILVKRGDSVRRGQVIAKSGQTGNVSSPQLHFEIRKGASPVDPMQFLNGAT